VNAAPGYSEHHAGRAIDVATPSSRPLEQEFESTDAFRWLAAHADAFGFRLSFPRDNRHGIAYEPWHYCYFR
jgi:zinc D-Ala-D-Ala carboxypeptidase